MPTPSASRERSYDGDYMESGQAAEEIVLGWLKSRPNVVEVIDCRSLRIMQDADIDFAVRTEDDRAFTIEVKSDDHIGKSGNILFELLRINHTSSTAAVVLGWSVRSQADWIVIYSPEANSLYIFENAKMRECFQRYTRDERGRVRIRWIPTDNIKSTLVALIPEERCKSFVKIYELPEQAPEHQ